jgi:hypothetical protein
VNLAVRRAWRWYWRTLKTSWGKMSPSQRRRFVFAIGLSLVLPTGVVVAVALAPHARSAIILGFVACWLLANVVLTVIRVRRSRRRD